MAKFDPSGKGQVVSLGSLPEATTPAAQTKISAALSAAKSGTVAIPSQPGKNPSCSERPHTAESRGFAAMGRVCG